MSGTTDPEYTFTCPTCGESLSVDESMKEALVEKGCVICGTEVTWTAFTAVVPTD